MGLGGQRHAPAALPPEKTRYPFMGGWVGPKAGLDGCGKSRPRRDSIPGSHAHTHTHTHTYITQCCFPRHEGIPLVQMNSYSFLSLAGPGRFTPGKQRWYSLKMRLGKPITGLDVLVERKMPCLCRDSNPGPFRRQPSNCI